MKRIDDPLDDFTVVNRTPTEKELRMLSERICQEKAERAKNPSSIDFFINSGNPTQEDFKRISAFIKKDKMKKASVLQKKGARKTPTTKKVA